MTGYLLRRLLLMVPTLLGISVAVFLLIQLVPGGPVEQAVQKIRGTGGGGEGGGRRGVSTGLTRDAVEQLRRYYGFDRPLHERYLRWLGKMVTLDFGTSYNYRTGVWPLIRSRIPISVLIAGTGFLLSYLIC